MDDNAYMTKMATAFLEELTEIEKKGFIGPAAKFLGGGFKTLGRLGATGAQKASVGGLHRLGRMAYGKGAREAAAAGKSQLLGGLKGLAQSQTGQALGAAGLTGLGAYGGYKALTS
jgi:hypothetical protein